MRFLKALPGVGTVTTNGLKVDRFYFEITEIGRCPSKVLSAEALGIQHQTVHVENDGINVAGG
jgi:hypothetical protein